MPDISRSRELQRGDVEAELTKLLRQGYGLLTVKIHGHRIAQLDTTTRHTRISQADDDEG